MISELWFWKREASNYIDQFLVLNSCKPCSPDFAFASRLWIWVCNTFNAVNVVNTIVAHNKRRYLLFNKTSKCAGGLLCEKWNGCRAWNRICFWLGHCLYWWKAQKWLASRHCLCANVSAFNFNHFRSCNLYFCAFVLPSPLKQTSFTAFLLSASSSEILFSLWQCRSCWNFSHALCDHQFYNSQEISCPHSQVKCKCCCSSSGRCAPPILGRTTGISIFSVKMSLLPPPAVVFPVMNK